jgi:hypothetical protein
MLAELEKQDKGTTVPESSKFQRHQGTLRNQRLAAALKG